MTPPREVLIKMASGFIQASSRAAHPHGLRSLRQRIATAATATPTTAPTNTPANTSTPGVSTGIEVELKIVEYAWLRVIVDGEEAFVGSLEAGTTRTWRGRGSIILRCGNAGGVEATVNGEPLGLLGERGQVVDMEWFAEGVTPTPATSEATVTPTATP